MTSQNQQKTIVVGAGPVGSLAALYAAQRGDNVEIYELRGDLRDPATVPLNFTKSINLALSERGINAIRHANRPDLLHSIRQDTIPMRGRMIHGEKNGRMSQESQAYDIHGRFISACDRAGLNKRLLNELERLTNVKIFFDHKLVGADFKRNLAWFERRAPAADSSTHIPPSEIEVSFDFMIGADGAHSATRYHLMKFARMNYQQEYIDTLWCEFHMTPKISSGEPAFKISPNYLHIWPSEGLMFIAIPSADKSFTCTLFMSASKFQELDDKPQDLTAFFKKHFPGVVPDLISETEAQHQYRNNPHLPLISIKCKPYHYKSSVVILGDAAHAMVPFYGQGMNAGLEDVRVLYDHLDRYTKDSSDTESMERKRGKALSEYTRSRHLDAIAINDLALRNYHEMSHDVTSSMYLLRKFVEERLDAYLPSLGWATQYSRISFGNERYSEVEKAEKKQRTIMLAIIGLIAGTLGSWTAWRILRWKRAPPSRALATWFASLATTGYR